MRIPKPGRGIERGCWEFVEAHTDHCRPHHRAPCFILAPQPWRGRQGGSTEASFAVDWKSVERPKEKKAGQRVQVENAVGPLATSQEKVHAKRIGAKLQARKRHCGSGRLQELSPFGCQFGVPIMCFLDLVSRLRIGIDLYRGIACRRLEMNVAHELLRGVKSGSRGASKESTFRCCPWGLWSESKASVHHTYIHTPMNPYIHPYIHPNIHTYIRTHTYIICTYIRTPTHTHAHTHTHTNIHTNIHTHTHLRTDMHTHTYIHTYRHARICPYLPTYPPAYLFIHTYIHTHIHIYMHARNLHTQIHALHTYILGCDMHLQMLYRRTKQNTWAPLTSTKCNSCTHSIVRVPWRKKAKT